MMSSDRTCRILGFDVRKEVNEELRSGFGPEPREVFLLRPEVYYPLSVDSHIWPSVFAYDTRNPGGIPAYEELGRLWSDLSKVRAQLLAAGGEGVNLVVELFVPDDADVDVYPSPLIYTRASPDRVPDRALFLGYDVADAGPWSGLSNMGYAPEERGELRSRWAGRINDNGLLDDENDAFEFRDLSDRRAPEHAPFWVYRLHALPSKKTGSGKTGTAFHEAAAFVNR